MNTPELREQEFGYICKACNGPAPVGIGYVADAALFLAGYHASKEN